MKKRMFISVVGATVLFAIVGLVANAQKSSPTKEFMRQKLEHSQRVLEGITTENFELVAKHARNPRQQR